MADVSFAEKILPAFGVKDIKLNRSHTIGLRRCLLSFTVVYCVLSIALFCFAQEIKPPNVAGTFYPDDPRELSQKIDKFLDAVNPEPVENRIFALISPHAGYDFSGLTAAYGYKLIKGRDFKTVIIIGASHYYSFNGVSVYTGSGFRTPLGEVKVDKKIVDRLIDPSADINFIPEAFSREHSVEVQIPFLQMTLADFKIVPIVIGRVDFSQCQNFARYLSEAIGEREDVLIVASTDMHHGYDYIQAEEMDNHTINLLRKMDPQILYDALREGRAQLCGGMSVIIAMITARELGHKRLNVLHYTNSAQVTNRKQKGLWTVGYASCVIDSDDLESGATKIESMADKQGDSQMLNQAQRKRLLEIARNSLETYLNSGKKINLTETDPALIRVSGAFVTLHKHGKLRGCIGNIIGTQPLYLTVRDMAIAAAINDPRFPSVSIDELGDIEIEISALSQLKSISDPLSIKLGVHGVLIKKGFDSGVFLPQVATETGWSKEEFLSYLCSHKAGLSPDAWKDKATEIYIFTAEVFSEKNY